MNKKDLNYWIGLVMRRRHTALWAGGIVFGLVVLATFLWPPVYESTADILVQDNRAQYLASSDLRDNTPQNAAAIANPITEEDLNSEMQLLTSEYLVKQALKSIPVPAIYQSYAQRMMSFVGAAIDLPATGYHLMHSTPELTPRDIWAMKLEHHLKSNVIKRSDLIELTFKAHDPAWTKEFLERLLNEYMIYHADISHDPQAHKFFEEQAGELRKRLDASEDKLRVFEIAHGITDLDGQRTALVNRISDLRIQSERNGAQLASAQEQVAQLQGELNGTPERIGQEVRSVQDEALAQLKPQVMQLKTQRAELLTRYQPNSERIHEIDAQLAAAEKILANENHLVVQEKSTNLNPVWVTVKQNLDGAQTNAAASNATQSALADELKQARVELVTMVNDGVALGRLQRRVQTDQEAYLSYVRKSEEARTAQGLNLNKILNVSVAQPPLEPDRPVFPIVWLNLMAGLALGAGVGLGAAYWEEERDPKIYSPAAIAEACGLNTIAVLREES
ncbi:MAG: GumC family protein [Candidatus Binataceae bacterium]